MKLLFALFSYWPNKALRSVAILKSGMQSFVWYACNFCDFYKRKQFAIELGSWRHLSVADLIFSFNPLAIFFAIIAVIIYSLNAVKLCWRLTNVFNKIFKRLKPPTANRYSPSSISWVGFVVRILTPLPYCGPCVKCFCSTISMLKSCRIFFLVTPTRFLSSVKHVISKGFNGISTIALKNPSSLTVAMKIGYAPYCCKAFKFLACEINEFHTQIILQKFFEHKQAGRTLAGLTRRRQSEYQLCIGAKQ